MKRIPVLLVFVILSGCWDRYELEERAMILGIAIDIAQDEDLEDIPSVTHLKDTFPNEGKDYIKLTAQISLPGKIQLGPEGGGGEGSSKNAWVIETVGLTLKDAMANLQQQLAGKLYLGHVQIIVISEDVAKQGVGKINDYLKRNLEVRRTSWMLVNEGDASEVLKTAPPVDTVPSLYLSNTLDSAVRSGKLPREYLGKFWIDLADEGIDPILPSVKVEDNDRILIDGMAYFHGEKLSGKFAPVEIGAYMSMKDESLGGYSYTVQLPDQKGMYMVKAVKRDPRIITKLENGKPKAKINVKIDAAIDEENNANDLDQAIITKIEKETAKRAKKLSDDFIKNLQKDGSDILGIGARIRAKHKNYWNKEIKTNQKWSELYKEMDIEVNYEVEIKRIGMKWT